ncbi:hypothetical protein [Roseovarius sp. SYSU LYC5161]|jgi:aspartokinase-like uncharacterized kinase|uniref:hypothetical protein n=1 Tax=Roseovarius halophilus (ex Wu et al. 2025) TaxID=3376060 RepID=UPI002871A572|nr:hypothetical protein [Roseovarius sp.]
MDVMKTAEHARALLSSHGGKAEAEAARKAREFEDAGHNDEAAHWQAIRRAIMEQRGPRQA